MVDRRCDRGSRTGAGKFTHPVCLTPISGSLLPSPGEAESGRGVRGGWSKGVRVGIGLVAAFVLAGSAAVLRSAGRSVRRPADRSVLFPPVISGLYAALTYRAATPRSSAPTSAPACSSLPDTWSPHAASCMQRLQRSGTDVTDRWSEAASSAGRPWGSALPNWKSRAAAGSKERDKAAGTGHRFWAAVDDVDTVLDGPLRPGHPERAVINDLDVAPGCPEALTAPTAGPGAASATPNDTTGVARSTIRDAASTAPRWALAAELR